ncbi:hypothetical Protein psc1_01380 [Candidatus Phytoplasma solani]
MRFFLPTSKTKTIINTNITILKTLTKAQIKNKVKNLILEKYHLFD